MTSQRARGPEVTRGAVAWLPIGRRRVPSAAPDNCRTNEGLHGFGHQEAPQADGEEEAPQAAAQDASPASQQEVASTAGRKGPSHPWRALPVVLARIVPAAGRRRPDDGGKCAWRQPSSSPASPVTWVGGS